MKLYKVHSESRIKKKRIEITLSIELSVTDYLKREKARILQQFIHFQDNHMNEYKMNKMGNACLV